MQNKTELVKNYLYDIINKNKSETNFLLPSEKALCLKFGVSRITVKSALQELAAENLIYRHQGKGTFISFEAKQKLHNEKQKKINLIGLVLPDLNSNFMLNIINGVERYLSETDYRIVLYCTQFSQKKEIAALQELTAMGVAGILIYPVDQEIYSQELRKLINSRFPLVFIDRTLPRLNAHSVMSNHTLDVKMATQHLLELGHRNIGIISTKPDGTSTIIERLKGYDMALSANHIPIHRYYKLYDLENYDEQWEEKISLFFQKNRSLSAVIIFNSDLCTKTLYVLEKLHKHIPDDISVVAYADDYSGMDKFLPIPLTSIHQNTLLLGKTAAKILIRKIVAPDEFTQNIKISSEFIIKGSTKKFSKGRSSENAASRSS